jgi:hypothetical protein
MDHKEVELWELRRHCTQLHRAFELSTVTEMRKELRAGFRSDGVTLNSEAHHQKRRHELLVGASPSGLTPAK